MSLSSIEYSVCFQYPPAPFSSSWSPHIPFANYLVDLLQPAIVVAIDGKDGLPFLAFCQAVLASHIPSKCYAIGPWEDLNRLERLEQCCSFSYPEIAAIMDRGTEEALAEFLPGSVDLLHFVGVYSYEEAVQFLDAWQSRLSPKAVVLIDHILASEGQSGNQQFWRSLVEKYPCFELKGNNGLGLALVGREPVDEVRRLPELDEEEGAAVQKFFNAAGSVITQLLENKLVLDEVRGSLDDQLRQSIFYSQRILALERSEYELKEIHVSKAWKLVNILRLLRVKIFPPNNVILRGVKTGKKVLWVWRNEGPKAVARGIVRKLTTRAPLPTSSGGPSAAVSPVFSLPNMTNWYADWIRANEPNPEAMIRQIELARGLPFQPKISILAPVYNTPPQLLKEMIQSVQNQTYPVWELCLVNGSPNVQELRDILEKAARSDSRIRVKLLEQNLGISGNTNIALKMATGEYIHLLDHDDLIPPFALYEIARYINDHPDCEMVYSDEDRISEDGVRSNPFFKPDWSPDLLTAFMYVGHSTYKKDLVMSLGGFRSEFDFSQDYDLALRVSEKVSHIGHIPQVLYHWRETPQSAAMGGKDFARKSNIAAIEDAVKRRGLDAEVIELPSSNCVRYKVIGDPLVSIIIPTDDEQNALRSIVSLTSKTRYSNYEILLVCNSHTGRRVKSQYHTNERIRIVAYDAPYNFSAKCNAGVGEARGEFVLFMNDDVYPREEDWLEWMIGPFQQKGVGAVSPKLIYTNETVQHAGLISGVRGFFGTAFHTFYKDSGFYFNLLLSPRSVSALSAACMIMRKSVFEQVGQFDAVHTPIMHSDLDLCYKIRDAGLRLVYTPYTTLDHVGHQSIGKVEAKGIKHSQKADMFMLKRWTSYVQYDPYYPTNMRDLLYIDSPEKIRTYFGNQEPYLNCKKDVLIVCNDMTFSGAPLLALLQARHLRKEGYFVTVISPSDGALAEQFKNLNFPLVIDPLVMNSPERLELFIRDFDLIVVNTINLWRIVLYAKSIAKKVAWLVHESDYGCQQAERDAHIREALSKADRVIFPSKQTLQKYQRFNASNNFIDVHYGIDLPAEMIKVSLEGNEQKLRVVHVGSVEPRKGQDVLVQAIGLLPQELREQFEFYFVGRVLFSDYFHVQQKKTARFSNVHWVGEVPPDHAIGYTAASDILVCSSRDETGPLVVYEAMGLGKTAVSTPVGVVPEIIENGKNGYIFPKQDAQALSDVLRNLEKNRQVLATMGQAALRTFNTRLTSECYTRALFAEFPPLD